jgi:hypothetical protein
LNVRKSICLCSSSIPDGCNLIAFKVRLGSYIICWNVIGLGSMPLVIYGPRIWSICSW